MWIGEMLHQFHKSAWNAWNWMFIKIDSTLKIWVQSLTSFFFEDTWCLFILSAIYLFSSGIQFNFYAMLSVKQAGKGCLLESGHSMFFLCGALLDHICAQWWFRYRNIQKGFWIFLRFCGRILPVSFRLSIVFSCVLELQSNQSKSSIFHFWFSALFGTG